MKYVFGLIGFLLIAGAVGSQDYYEECLAAADCVAGDPPSLIGTVVICIVGIALMLISMAAFISDTEDR